MADDQYRPLADMRYLPDASPLGLNALASLGKIFMAPGQAYQSTTPISSEDMIKPALNLAGTMTLGAGAIPAEANTLRAGAGSTAETMARFFNKETVPPPKGFMDRIWDNYASRMTPEELANSEAVWGGASRMARETGVREHEAFSDIMNNMLTRMGQRASFTPDIAQQHMSRALTDMAMKNLLQR